MVREGGFEPPLYVLIMQKKKIAVTAFAKTKSITRLFHWAIPAW